MDLTTLKANACATADAMGLLFGQQVEIVVHDLASGTITHIVNPYSRRVPGDPSNVQDIDFRKEDMVIGPYEKVHWDGSILRSISIVQRMPDGRAAFMICVNYDQSDLLAVQRAVEALLPARPVGQQPDDLFRNDWHERLNIFVSDWCQERGARVDTLDRASRRALLAALDASGALSERNAAAYVGRLLGVSRATIYNDLKAGASDV
ncbi:PAS domain-containing protein [Shimia sp. R10_1]|uniref:helix-turn-helix transcriptional regulator n=1 Tax=Shimia sp. R10_1 TaxID=2821095 RepID=UPI001ADA0EB2|nr:PAS domain-containing protein [Shimia sp. R10_1]